LPDAARRLIFFGMLVSTMFTEPYSEHEDRAALKGLRPEIRAALQRALAAMKVIEPHEIPIVFDGVVVKIGIGRPARGSRIWVTSLATLRCPTPRLLDAIAREAGLQ
jgi:hypothetical protein